MRSPEKRAAWLAANKERLNAQQRVRRAAWSPEKRAVENKKSAERIKNWRAKNKGAAYKPRDIPNKKTGIVAQSLTEYNRLYKRLQREKQKEDRVLNAILKAIEASQGVK